VLVPSVGMGVFLYCWWGLGCLVDFCVGLGGTVAALLMLAVPPDKASLQGHIDIEYWVVSGALLRDWIVRIDGVLIRLINTDQLFLIR